MFGDKTLTGENELTWMAVVANILGDTQLFSVRLLTRGKSGVLQSSTFKLVFNRYLLNHFNLIHYSNKHFTSSS